MIAGEGTGVPQDYRKDIDGLRALAILPVVFFHYGLSKIFPGGFIGVDIFFVISGFLITKSIYFPIISGSFRFGDFYNRRMRRILPALFVVYFFCIAASILIEMPIETRETVNSIVASIFYASNIAFFYKSSYFDAQLQNNPMLHTWSLSVEEQFYILMPMALMVIAKAIGLPGRPVRATAERDHKYRVNFVLYIILISSFICSIYYVYHDRPCAFYLLQNRVWEFLVGSVVATGGLPAIRGTLLREALGLFGIGAIAASIAALNEKSAFPGLGAVAPCLGTAFILYSGENADTFCAKCLSYYPVRFIGLVSYSLYLWHWPVWIFSSYFFVPRGYSILLLIILAFGLAVASWRYIERPFRSKPFRIGPSASIAVAAVSMVAIAAVALVAPSVNSRLWQYSPDITSILGYMDYKPTEMRGGTCFVDNPSENISMFRSSGCLNFDSAKKNYLILGDSHAADLWYGLAKANPRAHFLQATAPGCKPFINAQGADDRCRDLMSYLINQFIPAHRFDGIILSADWTEETVQQAITTAQSFRPHANRLIIIGPSPDYDKPLPELLARAIFKRDLFLIPGHLLQKKRAIDRRFIRLIPGSGIQYISLYSALCSGDICVTRVDHGTPIMFDGEHFTAAGSALVAQRISQTGNPL